MRRRFFIQRLSALTGISWFTSQCHSATQGAIPGTIVGASAGIGHMLRDRTIQSEPSSVIYTEVAIVGGGISGLSAARWLCNNGIHDFTILDLEKKYGGNSASGKNDFCAYPWGAHYIPLPNNNLTEYLEFLQECGVITGYDENGIPLYNEYYLCFEPEERLFINGSWQTGLVPGLGLSDTARKEVLRFLQQMDDFRKLKGKDGKDVFAIPVNESSQDEQWKSLDSLTMKEWLQQEGYTSEYLHWYCNYCCRDDFGTRYDEASAWAGIHYFAGRKGKAANAKSGDVITWPQGNAWLADQLCKDYRDKIKVQSLVISVTKMQKGIEVLYYDVLNKEVKKLVAQHCILSTPQFISSRLLPQYAERQKLVQQTFTYSPWMVANITTQPLAERNGEPLCWDNVIYDTDSLGYVEATHQLLNQLIPRKVLTYYMPLTKTDANNERKLAMEKTHAEWCKIIIDELQLVHEDIKEKVQQIDVMVWGHAMIKPTRNFIFSDVREKLSLPVGERLFFAHTDLAGVSIFEEGFYQGIRAAKEVLATRNNVIS